MRQQIANYLQRIAKYWTAETVANASDAEMPDAIRRSMLLGTAALVAGAVFLPGVTGEAQAHSTRRSRRLDYDGRHGRRHSRAHHGRRRSWYRRHSRRRSRYWDHSRWRSERDYYYHNRRRSRGGPGIEFRFEF